MSASSPIICSTSSAIAVVSAASAEEALERLEAEPVDLLFSDVVMPGLSGIELARLARERQSGPAGPARQRL